MRPQARFRWPSHRAAASRARAADRGGARTSGAAARSRRDAATERTAPNVDLLTKVEIAAALGVSVRTVLRWMRAGMPYIRLGSTNRPRFKLQESAAWRDRPVE
jgi:hypothetical protein